MKALNIFNIFKQEHATTNIMIIWKIWIGSLQFPRGWSLEGFEHFYFSRMELPHLPCTKGGNNKQIALILLIFGLDFVNYSTQRFAGQHHGTLKSSPSTNERCEQTHEKGADGLWSGDPKDSAGFPNLAAWPELSSLQRETFKGHQLQLVIVHALQTWETYGRQHRWRKQLFLGNALLELILSN